MGYRPDGALEHYRCSVKFSAPRGKWLECDVQDFVPILRLCRFALPVVDDPGIVGGADLLPDPGEGSLVVDQVAVAAPPVDDEVVDPRVPSVAI